MKTINLTAHALILERRANTNVFDLVIDGLTPGRKPVRFRVECEGPMWIEEFAREFSAYLDHEQKKLDQAKAAMGKK